MPYSNIVERKRRAHIAKHPINLQHKLSSMKEKLRDNIKHSPTLHPTENSRMKQVAIDRIFKQQTNIQKEAPPKQPVEQETNFKDAQYKKYQIFLERQFKKIPEIIPHHAPPMSFYWPNRPFESRPATNREETIRLEARHQIYNIQEIRRLRKIVRK